MDPERKPEPPRTEPQVPVAELLGAAETAPEQAAAYAEWLRDHMRDRP